MPALRFYLQPVIAQHKVRYVGEPVAMVVAENAALAEDALDAIELDIESLPAVAGRDAARKDEIILFEPAGTNLATTVTAVRGDVEKAFRDAPYVRREHFSVQRHAAVPMESRGLLAEWDATQQRLSVSGAAKVPFANRRILAGMMGLPGWAKSFTRTVLVVKTRWLVFLSKMSMMTPMRGMPFATGSGS